MDKPSSENILSNFTLHLYNQGQAIIDVIPALTNKEAFFDFSLIIFGIVCEVIGLHFFKIYQRE